MNTELLIIIYLVVVNLLGFATMGFDKRRAIKRMYRIPEATLFTIAIIGGSVGSIFGMHLFHHKTKHWYFLWGMPVILVLQIALILFLIYNPSISVRIM